MFRRALREPQITEPPTSLYKLHSSLSLLAPPVRFTQRAPLYTNTFQGALAIAIDAVLRNVNVIICGQVCCGAHKVTDAAAKTLIEAGRTVIFEEDTDAVAELISKENIRTKSLSILQAEVNYAKQQDWPVPAQSYARLSLLRLSHMPHLFIGNLESEVFMKVPASRYLLRRCTDVRLMSSNKLPATLAALKPSYVNLPIKKSRSFIRESMEKGKIRESWGSGRLSAIDQEVADSSLFSYHFMAGGRSSSPCGPFIVRITATAETTVEANDQALAMSSSAIPRSSSTINSSFVSLPLATTTEWKVHYPNLVLLKVPVHTTIDVPFAERPSNTWDEGGGGSKLQDCLGNYLKAELEVGLGARVTVVCADDKGLAEVWAVSFQSNLQDLPPFVAELLLHAMDKADSMCQTICSDASSHSSIAENVAVIAPFEPNGSEDAEFRDFDGGDHSYQENNVTDNFDESQTGTNDASNVDNSISENFANGQSGGGPIAFNFCPAEPPLFVQYLMTSSDKTHFTTKWFMDQRSLQRKNLRAAKAGQTQDFKELNLFVGVPVIHKGTIKRIVRFVNYDKSLAETHRINDQEQSEMPLGLLMVPEVEGGELVLPNFGSVAGSLDSTYDAAFGNSKIGLDANLNTTEAEGKDRGSNSTETSEDSQENEEKHDRHQVVGALSGRILWPFKAKDVSLPLSLGYAVTADDFLSGKVRLDTISQQQRSSNRTADEGSPTLASSVTIVINPLEFIATSRRDQISALLIKCSTLGMKVRFDGPPSFVKA